MDRDDGDGDRAGCGNMSLARVFSSLQFASYLSFDIVE